MAGSVRIRSLDVDGTLWLRQEDVSAYLEKIAESYDEKDMPIPAEVVRLARNNLEQLARA